MSHFLCIVINEDVDKAMWPYIADVDDRANDSRFEFENLTTYIKNDYEQYKADNPGEDSNYLLWLKQNDLEDNYINFGIFWEDLKVVLYKVGRYYNPKKKYDWYLVGGAFKGFFETHEDKRDSVALWAWPFEEHIQKVRAEAHLEWERVNSLIAGRPFRTWKNLLKMVELGTIRTHQARKMYYDQPVIKDYQRALTKDNYISYGLDSFVEMTYDEYLFCRSIGSIAPYAYVLNGRWYQRGKMGSFSVDTNEMSHLEWCTKWYNALKSLDQEETVLHAVDCHI